MKIEGFDGKKWITLDDVEAFIKERESRDGIPRHVVGGRVMKRDWFISEELLEDNLTGESLEEHIANLMESQQSLQD